MERSVQYARERFFNGEEFQDLADVRDQAQRWCRDVAGLWIHGTTYRKPLVVFQNEERQALLPWDGEPYEMADWREAKVHQDHHIQCLQSPYSVPSTLCPRGQKVEVRVDSKPVRIYHWGQLIKTHVRQPRGGRATNLADHPAELSAYTTRAPDRIKANAKELGSSWLSSLTGSSRARCRGPKSGRATSCCVWASATPPSGWTPPAVGPWMWTSSTCAAWNASWCKPSRRRPPRSRPCR